jgi:hypothetical protein
LHGVKNPLEKRISGQIVRGIRAFISDAECGNIPLDSEPSLYMERRTMALKTMPIAKLQALKSQVEAAISAKVTERRHELELELSKLAGFGGRGKAVKFAGGGRMGPVAQSGKKLEDFLIPGAVTRASAAKPTKKNRKMRKAGK